MFSLLLFLFIINKCCPFIMMPNASSDKDFSFATVPINEDNPPSYFDWRDLKMVSPVKNQQRCKACWAFAAVGVLREEDYRLYTGSKLSCQWFKPPPIPVFVKGFQRVEPDEYLMVKMLWKYGPLSAGICSATMAQYFGNSIDEPTDEKCNPRELDHAVLIVGYNLYVSKDGKETPYWIIKNSWGTEWGDAVYYYLVRGRNACGIANDVSFPIV